MIPFPLPVLTGLTILVTRPAVQAGSLCAAIGACGGVALSFPTIVIEPLAQPRLEGYPGPAWDLLVFTSVNAVAYGVHHLGPAAAVTAVAAIGPATASAVAAAGLSPPLSPDAEYTSEALLGHPALDDSTLRRVLIVRGVGGRELLCTALRDRGHEVGVLEVYRRVPPVADPAAVDELETRWLAEGIDAITATSVEVLDNLHGLLTATGRGLLTVTAVVAASSRVVDAARALGCRDVLLAAGAGDDAIITTLARRQARAR